MTILEHKKIERDGITYMVTKVDGQTIGEIIDPEFAQTEADNENTI